MFEVQIYIPEADNDGVDFSEQHHAVFEAKALELFGGVTLARRGVEGQWLDDGRLYKDIIRVYAIGVDSLTDGAKIGELVETAKSHYRQEAIFIRFLGVCEIL